MKSGTTKELTEDEEAKKAFLTFIEQVEPEVKKARFELNKKVVTSEFAADLDQARYGVLLRDWNADVSIFRDKNVPLCIYLCNQCL